MDVKLLGQMHPDVARDWNNLGMAWASKSEYDKAINYCEKALLVVEKVGLPQRIHLVKNNITAFNKKAGRE